MGSCCSIGAAGVRSSRGRCALGGGLVSEVELGSGKPGCKWGSTSEHDWYGEEKTRGLVFSLG